MHFLLSPDKEFTAIGSNSGIEYERDCNDLKRLLVVEADGATVKGIVKFWDGIVFSGITSSGPVGNESEGDEDDGNDNFEDLAVAIWEIDLHHDDDLAAGPSVTQPPDPIEAAPAEQVVTSTTIGTNVSRATMPDSAPVIEVTANASTHQQTEGEGLGAAVPEIGRRSRRAVAKPKPPTRGTVPPWQRCRQGERKG